MCPSATHSSPIQPISASRSGIGAVATMSLVIGRTARRISGSEQSHALLARTTLSATISRRPHGVIPGTDVRRRRRGVQYAARSEIGVDSVVGTDPADGRDGRGGLTGEPHPFLFAILVYQSFELLPPTGHKSAIAPTCPRATDVRLQQNHVHRRI